MADEVGLLRASYLRLLEACFTSASSVFRYGCIEIPHALESAPPNPIFLQQVGAMVDQPGEDSEGRDDLSSQGFTDEDESDKERRERCNREKRIQREERESHLGKLLNAGATLGSRTSLSRVAELLAVKGKSRHHSHPPPKVVYLHNNWRRPGAWRKHTDPE